MNEKLIEKWKPLVEFYERNGFSKERIYKLCEKLEENEAKFVKNSHFDKGIFFNIIAEWKKGK